MSPTVAEDAIATLRVALRAVTALPLDLATATDGLRVADELRAVFQWSIDTREATPLPGADRVNRMRMDTLPLTLLELPPDVLLLLFCRLDLRSLMRIAATCSMLYRDPQTRPMTLVEEALRERAAARGYMSPMRLPEAGVTSWVQHLAWLERRRDEAWVPLAARTYCSFFVAEGGQLMSCGTEDDMYSDVHGGVNEGVLGHGDLNDDDFVLKTPSLLPSMADIRITCVSAGEGFNAAVSAAGDVYTWGVGEKGQLGHGDQKRSIIPRQVSAFADHRILSIATSDHCMAVTERGEVFIWGRNDKGQCGNGSSSDNQLLPRRVEALAGVRSRSASAGTLHSLVVTEDGALYTFGAGSRGELGHGNYNDTCNPAIVESLRSMRIVAAAAGHSHSIALTADGVVFSWGDNCYGQLGWGSRFVKSKRASPRKSALPKKVMRRLSGLHVCAVVAAEWASAAVTATGELFTWGNGECGRLGHGDEADQFAPKRVEALQNEFVVTVTCAYRHTMAALRDARVFGWGYFLGLGFPEAYATVANDSDACCVFTPCRYQQLSCMQ
jgi:alpha-tubulin suppressor-like RCC1 family protein